MTVLVRNFLTVAVAIITVTAASIVLAQQQPKRIALLIGNQGYSDAVGPLKNPHNDMVVVGRALNDVGFTLQEPVKDGTRDDMLFAVHELAAALRKVGRGAIGFLYYTGHGIAVGGDNVLIPKNARGTSDAELNVRGVKLAEILDILKRDAPDAVHFVVLDACRNNIRGQRGAKGFAPVNDQRTGVVLAFATAAGETASDEGATSGPYAAALAEEIVKPGRNDQSVFNSVRSRVVAATRTQTPWTHDGLVGERVVFKQAAAAPVPSPAASALGNEAAQAWPLVMNSRDIMALEAFRKQYGMANPFFDRLAESRIEELKRSSATATKTVDESNRANADALRQAENVKRQADAETKRRADAAIQTDEALKQAERVRQLAEAETRRRTDAAKKQADDDARAKADAERQRVAAEQRKQEMAMLQQEETRKAAEAEAARKQAEAASTMRPGHVFRDCPDCPEMVVIPAGEFMMGSPANEKARSADEGPQRKVTIKAPFAAGKFEVTFAEWDACVAASGCKHKPDDHKWGRGKRPVINVSWDDITKEYLPWLSRKSGKTYRLLTESEWEYAARAGTTTRYAFGDQINRQQAQFSEGSFGSAGNTAEVGSFQPNRFGLFDMHGSVWELTHDCHKDSYGGAPNDGRALADTTSCLRVLRGGSWNTNPQNLRSALRLRAQPGFRSGDIGFRLARTL
jgi:formylglycine-generating enzyme required for sulfatase activity